MDNPYNDNNINIDELNINDLTIIDILNLLSLSTNDLITKKEEEIIKIINIRINNLKEKFKKLNLTSYVDLFEKIKNKFNTDTNIDNNTNNNSNTNNINNNSNIQGIDTSNYESQANIVLENDDQNNEINYLTNYTKYSNYLGKIVRKFINKTLVLDSRYRDNYLNTISSDFNFTLKEPIKNVIELKLLDIEIKNSFYPINQPHLNNYFWIKIYDNNNNTYFYLYIFLKDAWYHDIQIVTLLNTNLNNIGITFLSFELNKTLYNNHHYGNNKIKIINTDNNYSIELNFNNIPISNFINIDNDDFTKVIYKIDYDLTDYDYFYNTPSNNDIKSRLGFMFGFYKETYLFTDSIISDRVVDLTGSRYFYVFLNDFSNNFNSTLFPPFENYNLNNNLFCKITNTVEPFTLNNNTIGVNNLIKNSRYYNGPINLEKIQLKILDEFGRIVDFNGYDLSISLDLKIIYSN